ncbi:MAG: dipicolinate synthase subunit B [Clostridia bacterium]|nr:dipicolinate synthase subunit B [Clostridia bacterium]
MKQTVGFALTGSFCTLDRAFSLMEELQSQYEIIPILSERVANTDTRFHTKEEVLERVRSICGKEPITTITEAEPLGPRGLLDLLLVCPCTGNTLSKMALGITDTSVTMAVKSHRRGGKGVLIALSTNDALSGSAKSLGTLLDRRGYYFVPLKQDDPKAKPASLQCDFQRVPEAVAAALEEKQLQPLFYHTD